MHHCVFMHLVIPSFYDSTNTCVTRHNNDHYIYHNAATITIPTGRLTTTLENAIPTKKGAQEVCESTGGFIFARTSRV